VVPYGVSTYRPRYINTDKQVSALFSDVDALCARRDEVWPSQGNEFLSEAVVESAQRQANERFLWVAGEWRFAIDLSQEAISFPWNVTWKTEERKFTLSEQDVAR
jgi:hypothetical protein